MSSNILLPFLNAFLTFFIFIFFAIFRRITGSKTAFRDLIFIHAKFSLVYIVFAILGHLLIESINLFDWLAGLFIYFGLHHTVFLYLITIPRRSVSMNLCVSAYELKRATLAQIEESYGKGKGMDYVASDRLDAIEKLGFIQIQDSRIHITKLGKIISLIHLIVLKIWGLKSNTGAEGV